MSRVYRAPLTEEDLAPETVASSRWAHPRQRQRQRPAAPVFVPPSSVEEGDAQAAPLRARLAACEAVLAEPGPRPGESEAAWGIRRGQARAERGRIAPIYTPLAQWLRAQRRALHGEAAGGTAARMLELLDIVERLSEEGAELTDAECTAVELARGLARTVRTLHRAPEPDGAWAPAQPEPGHG